MAFYSTSSITPDTLDYLRLTFGKRLQENASLARYTAARTGGPAQALLEAGSARELEDGARQLWEMGIPFFVLGGGSNVLVSDRGVPGVVLLNRARRIVFDESDPQPAVWAESGANFGLLARQAAARGLSGLEWAAGIPGTLGGAIVGNAGAHGGDMTGSLLVADILHRKCTNSGEWITVKEQWPVDQLEYAYRSSILKRRPGKAVVLTGTLSLEPVDRANVKAIQAKMDAFNEHRRCTQPPGASMGSMFKNPSGDYAGRLIEAAGLKGTQHGGAEISNLHANFFVNNGQASAADVYALLKLAKKTVLQRFGVELELEIELIGNWNSNERI